MGDIIDTIIYGGDKWLKNIGTKTRDISGVAKMKMEIGNMKKEKKEIFMEMGRMVYKMYEKEEFDIEKLKNMSMKISQLNKDIRLKRDQIDGIHDTSRETFRQIYNKTRKTEKEEPTE